jgi:hypothetical protein
MHSHHSYKYLISIIIVPLLLIQVGVSQTKHAGDARLPVAVVDPSGSAIVAARIQLSAEGQSKDNQTDARGVLQLAQLRTGQYHLHIEAEGFEPKDLDEVNLNAGNNEIQVQLELAPIKEQMSVTLDQREKLTDPNGPGFATVLTQDQIAQLPDDPEELEATLKQMGGPGAVIRINGFRGGKLPPKSQIQEIRFRRNPYAVENHEAGIVAVDIFTKPGLDDWHGTLGGAFRNESLNARNAFAPLHSPEQYRRFGFDIGGPLWRNHTSLFFSAEGANFYDSKIIVAALPEGPFNDIIRKPSRFLNISTRVEHLLTKSHTLRFQYQRSGWRDDNLGVGDYDLPDRAYSTETVENFLRVSDSGPLTLHIVNEFRFQARWQSLKSNAASDSPAILVLNAFNRGGSQIQSDRRIRTFELEDGADFVFGQHSMKAEVRFEAGNYDTSELQNANGTFTFSSLDAFSAGCPTTYTRRIGDPSVSFAQYHFD